MTTTVALTGTPATTPYGTWTIDVSVTGTDGPYDGRVEVWDNNVAKVVDTALTAGFVSTDIGGFNSDTHVLFAKVFDSSNVLIPSTSTVMAFSIVGFGSDNPALYPTNVTKGGVPTLEVDWTPPELDTSTDIDDVRVTYWDSAWIGDGTYPSKVHTSSLARNATADSYTFPDFDPTHTYNAMVIAHKETIISFGLGETIVENYYPLSAIQGTVSLDPPPFWPTFSLGAQTGDSRVKFDPAP